MSTSAPEVQRRPIRLTRFWAYSICTYERKEIELSKIIPRVHNDSAQQDGWRTRLCNTVSYAYVDCNPSIVGSINALQVLCRCHRRGTKGRCVPCMIAMGVSLLYRGTCVRLEQGPVRIPDDVTWENQRELIVESEAEHSRKT